ncbi:hypothetical protein PCC6912_52870 [Chlorogloeopsis fritschii PCC 6912]|uniref:Uncharacterized protein n=1 Tax=Chlorogloeopsis fritschii PCC 6912 TaxID=211165 RepID=A0A3S0Y1B1_CHLFR|nr:hypothetical protein PCC6912_52870 [Chlorogloeopsis fritschii PCC 6912]
MFLMSTQNNGDWEEDKVTPRRSEGMKEGRYEGIYSYSLAPTLPHSPPLPLSPSPLLFLVPLKME